VVTSKVHFSLCCSHFASKIVRLSATSVSEATRQVLDSTTVIAAAVQYLLLQQHHHWSFCILLLLQITVNHISTISSCTNKNHKNWAARTRGAVNF
jgi:hypothetical protein